MHYDTVRYSEWLPSAALLTGAAWYCISIAHDDIIQRGRRADLQRWQQHRAQVQATPHIDINVANAFNTMRDHNRDNIALRRRNASAKEREKITPSKLSRTDSGKFHLDVDCDKGVGASAGAGAGYSDNSDNVKKVIPIIQETSCPICLDDFVHDEVLRALACCKHTFHEKCVGSWLEINEHCPLCRTKIDSDQTGWGYLVHALFE